MIELSDWLDQRLNDVPDALRARVRAAVAVQCTMCKVDHTLAPCTLHVAHLKSAATSLLEEVISAQDHADPINLLASDALITFACEAQAELDPAGLAEIT